MTSTERLQKQLNLVLELDQLKSVLRKTRVKSAQNRDENSAEHSWQVALMALMLEEHSNEPVDISRVVKMLLIHDVVEIDCGDVLVYDQAAIAANTELELQSARRLFGLLPEDQGAELLALWQEFEAMQTADAKFAKACDRLIPMLINYDNQGVSWRENKISQQQALRVNQKIALGSEILWNQAQTIIEDATQKGWLRNEENH